MDRLRRLSDIIVYNLLFVVCSIPVVTAGAALIALCDGMQRLSIDKKADFPVAKTFFDSFRRNFKRGTFLWIITVFGYFFLYSLLFAARSLSGGSYGTMYMASFYVMLLLMLFGYQNLFPSAARWQEQPAIGIIFRAYQVAGASLLQTFFGICVTSLISGLTMAYNPLAIPFGFMFWVVGGFGITTYICTGFFTKAAKKFEENLREELKT